MVDPSRSGSILCGCGAGICLLFTSKTRLNPGRPYYTCPAAQRCGFFKWSDQVPADELIAVPLCACGAGICRLDIMTAGPNVGRKFFVCPIKKGQGACSFFMWLDAHATAATNLQVDESGISPRSTLTNCSDVSPANSDQIDQSSPSTLRQEIESLHVYTSRCSKNLVPASGVLKRDKIMREELKGSEDTMDGSLRKHCKRLRYGDSKSDGSPSGSSAICLTTPFCANLRDYLTEEDVQAGSQTFEMENHRRQKGFCSQNFTQDTTLAASENFLSSYHPYSAQLINSKVFQEFSWIVAAIDQNLSSQIRGWWGRLVFSPSKCLMERAAKPFFCCVFPSFDPIFVPPNVNDRSSATTFGSPLAAASNRLSMLALHEGARLLGTEEHSTMRDLVSKAFVKAGEELQSDLLTVLKSLDIQDHEIMVQEADTTFDALDQLQIDHKIFSEQVKEFIRTASLLDKIDQSIRSDHSCQMLADHCNDEKVKLDEMNDAYARVADAFSVSKQRAASLNKEVAHLKDKLFQTKAELSCCEAESIALKACMSEMFEEKQKFEQSFQSTCKKLEDALKLHKQREAAQHGAKAAFEKAKLLLWG